MRRIERLIDTIERIDDLIEGLALAAIGHAGQIARSVGGLVLVVAVAIWPVYMGPRAYQAKERQVPFPTAYILASSVVIVQQFIIGRDLQ